MKQIFFAVLILITGRSFAQDPSVEPTLKTTGGIGSAKTVSAGEFNWIVNSINEKTDTTEVYTKTRSDRKFATKTEVDLKAPLNNPTFTGIVTIPETPSNASDAASKGYVDNQVSFSLVWQDPVRDIVSTLANGRPSGHRYILSTDGHINVSDGDDTWTDLGATTTGTTVYVMYDSSAGTNSVGPYTFNGTSWVSIGTGSVHNDLTSLQGGSSTERYHLTSAQATVATQTATAARNGVLSSADWSTFNGKQAALVSGTNIKTINGSSVLGSGNMTIAWAGVFNVLDYGAVSGDGLNDADNFRLAMDAADAYTSSYFGNGYVLVPPGDYNFTDSVVLKNQVFIIGSPGAVITVADEWHGGVFVCKEAVLKRGGIIGNGLLVYQSNHTATGLKIIQTTSIVASFTGWSKFNNLEFYGLKYGIYIETRNHGWFNFNILENIFLTDCVYGMEGHDDGTGDGMEANSFINIKNQSTANTLYDLKDWDGKRNDFIGWNDMDLAAGKHGVTFGTLGYYNRFTGGYVSSTGFSDASTYGNWINTNNPYLNRPEPLARKLMFDIYANRDSLYKIDMQFQGASGSIASPNGWGGIRFRSLGSNPWNFTSNNSAAAIVVGNALTADYRGILKIQVANASGSLIDAQSLSPTEAWINLLLLPVYADNAAAVAAGKRDGVLYRTSAGALMVVDVP